MKTGITTALWFHRLWTQNAFGGISGDTYDFIQALQKPFRNLHPEKKKILLDRWFQKLELFPPTDRHCECGEFYRAGTVRHTREYEVVDEDFTDARFQPITRCPGCGKKLKPILGKYWEVIRKS